jgi:cytochrome b
MKTYIWTLPTRIFHWLLAISFAAAYLLGGEENYLNVHAALGSMIGGLVLFRIIQGFAGPRYARFSDFPVSPVSIKSFIINMKQAKASHPGHNPLAASIMLGIIFTALISAISGMLIFASGGTGIFGIRLNPGFDPEFFEEIHEIAVNIFLFLVGIHLTGILVDTIFHSSNGTLFSIFTGYKKIQAENVLPSAFQKIFSVFWFTLPLLLFCYVLLYQPMPAEEKDQTEQVNESDEDED